MERVGQRIKRLRKKNHWTQQELAKKVSRSPQVISNWEREYTDLSREDVILLADVFNVSTDYINCKTDFEKQNPLPYGAEPIDFSTMEKLPILGTIRAGEPIYMAENIEGYEYVSPTVTRGRKGFILRVKGDSMSGDRIHEGDMVVCISQEECEPSDIAVVAINGEEATLKRVKCQGDQCILSSSNPKYEPMIYPLKEVHILGIVEMVMFRLNK